MTMEYDEYVRAVIQAALKGDITQSPAVIAAVVQGHKWPSVARAALNYAIPHFKRPDDRWWEGVAPIKDHYAIAQALGDDSAVIRFVREFMSRMHEDEVHDGYEALSHRLGLVDGIKAMHSRLSYMRFVDFAARVESESMQGLSLATAVQKSGDYSRAVAALDGMCGADIAEGFADIVLPAAYCNRPLAERLKLASLHELSVIFDAALHSNSTRKKS